LQRVAAAKLASLKSSRSTEWTAPATCEEFFRDQLKLDISAAQWVFVRVAFDRVDPIDLAPEDRAVAAIMFGPCERIAPASKSVIAQLKGQRCGGTWLWSLFLLYRALTADLSRLAAGEVGFAAIVAPAMEQAKQSINYIVGALDVLGLASWRTSTLAESITLKRPDGHRVTMQVFAASRGGVATRSRSYIGALLDEACFFRAADSGVVNDQEIYRSIASRVMVGGTLGLVSTAFAEQGLLWDLLKRNLGVPGGELTGRHETALACITPTLVLRDDEKIKADEARDRILDPENAAREYDCIPLSQNTAAFFANAELLAAQARGKDLTEEILPNGAVMIGAGIDTGLVRDASALVVCHLVGDRYTVALSREQRPKPGAPLKLSEVCAYYREDLGRHRCYQATADVHEFEASKEYLDGIELLEAPTGISGKQEAYTLVRTLLREDRLTIPPGETNDRLVEQLRNVMSKPVDGGKLRITSPRGRGGHGDLASALVNAVWQLHAASGANAQYDPQFDAYLPDLRI